MCDDICNEAVPFRPYCAGVITQSRNVSEYILVLAVCLVQIVDINESNCESALEMASRSVQAFWTDHPWPPYNNEYVAEIYRRLHPSCRASLHYGRYSLPHPNESRRLSWPGRLTIHLRQYTHERGPHLSSTNRAWHKNNFDDAPDDVTNPPPRMT